MLAHLSSCTFFGNACRPVIGQADSLLSHFTIAPEQNQLYKILRSEKKAIISIWAKHNDHTVNLRQWQIHKIEIIQVLYLLGWSEEALFSMVWVQCDFLCKTVGGPPEIHAVITSSLLSSLWSVPFDCIFPPLHNICFSVHKWLVTLAYFCEVHLRSTVF